VEFSGLVASFAQDSSAKQAAFARTAGDHDWSYDDVDGVLRLRRADGTTLQYPAQLLGAESSDGRFTWSWSDPDVHPSLTHVARLLRKLGEQQGFPMLTTPEFRTAELGTSGEALAMLASGLTRALFYYRASHDDGALFLLV
jgi:hypothetical protein